MDSLLSRGSRGARVGGRGALLLRRQVPRLREDDPYGEGPQVLHGSGPHCLDGAERKGRMGHRLRSEYSVTRGVVCELPLFLERHELLGEIEYWLWEVSGRVLETSALPLGMAMFESSVDVLPCPLASLGGGPSDEHVGAAGSQPVKQCVVAGADRSPQVRLSGLVLQGEAEDGVDQLLMQWPRQLLRPTLSSGCRTAAGAGLQPPPVRRVCSRRQ